MSKLLSMFRSKSRYLYATIKGTLTENNGVFSGFSASNYLQLQQAIPNLDSNSKLEIFIDCKIQSYTSTNVFFGATDGDTYNIKCQMDNQKRLFGYIYNNTTSTRLITPVIRSTSAIENSRLQIKYTISNNVLRIERSIDGSSFYGTEVSLGENFTYTKGIKLCLGKVLDGSIDLNNSYIKLGSTKYKLQAVVGYTVVGSPTITDGVVSGFSSANYIYVPNFDIGNDFELITKIKLLEASNSNYLLRLPKGNVNLNMVCYINSANKLKLSLQFNNKTNSETGGITTFSLNTDIYLRFVQKGNFTKFFSSLDKLNWVEEMSIQTDKDIRGSGTGYDMSFGIASILSGYYLKGLIYIGETTIYVKNKLWFNGYEG